MISKIVKKYYKYYNIFTINTNMRKFTILFIIYHTIHFSIGVGILISCNSMREPFILTMHAIFGVYN